MSHPTSADLIKMIKEADPTGTKPVAVFLSTFDCEPAKEITLAKAGTSAAGIDFVALY